MAISSRGRQASPGDCFGKALDLLSRRPHFRRELEKKLEMRGFGSEEVESALDRAAERGFLNDMECARDFVRTRVERRHEGPAKLVAALGRKGVESETVRRAVAECFPDGEAEHLEQAARLWLDRHAWDYNRLARHLNGKGFSGGAILTALERFEGLNGGNSGAEETR